MNQYLEKIAKFSAFKKATNFVRDNSTAIKWGAAGATYGGISGYAQKKDRTGKKLSEDNRKRNAVIAAVLLGGVSGHMGHNISQLRKWHGRHSGYSSNQAAPSAIHALHESLHMPKGGFKTKREATAHFRKIRSQYHPDKHPHKREEMNKKMSELNAAWDAFEKHPEGFTKLANAYLVKLAETKKD